MSCVYLLHYDRPYPLGRRPQHYAGSTTDLRRRLAEHASGNPGKHGSLPRAFASAGIAFRVARTWECATREEAREQERKIKKLKKLRLLCPECVARRRALPEGTVAKLIADATGRNE